MLYITKIVRFSAAHRLFNPEFSDEENDRIYDKCTNYYGHGHNYVLAVTIAGNPNPYTGYLFDLKVLKKLLHDEIISQVDHKHLNFDVPFLQGIIPTVENLSIAFWNILKYKVPTGKLHKIQLSETETSYAEYFGELAI